MGMEEEDMVMAEAVERAREEVVVVAEVAVTVELVFPGT